MISMLTTASGAQASRAAARSGIVGRQVGEGRVHDDRAVGQRVVVADGQAAVGGAADVQLHAVGSLVHGPEEGSQGVLGEGEPRLPGARSRAWQMSPSMQQKVLAGVSASGLPCPTQPHTFPQSSPVVACETRHEPLVTRNRRGGTSWPSLRPAPCTLTIERDDWRDVALCRDTDPDLFFPVGTTGPAIEQIENAKAVCRQCEAQAPCLEYALATNQDSGVWGGTSEEERRQLRKQYVARQRRTA